MHVILLDKKRQNTQPPAPKSPVYSSTTCQSVIGPERQSARLQYPGAQFSLTLSDTILVTVRFLFGDGRTSLVSCLGLVQRLITLESQEENYLAPVSYLKLQALLQLDQLLSSLLFCSFLG